MVSSFHICYKYRTVNHAIVVVSIEDEYEGGFVSERLAMDDLCAVS